MYKSISSESNNKSSSNVAKPTKQCRNVRWSPNLCCTKRINVLWWLIKLITKKKCINIDVISLYKEKSFKQLVYTVWVCLKAMITEKTIKVECTNILTRFWIWWWIHTLYIISHFSLKQITNTSCFKNV